MIGSLKKSATTYKIGTMRLTPKDIVVVKIDDPINVELMNQVKDRVQSQFPKNQVLVVAAGANLSIIKKVKR